MDMKPLQSLAMVLSIAASTLATFGYEQNLEKSFQVSPGGKLVIDADRGSIEIRPESADKVEVQVLRKVKDGSKSHADELFAEHQVALNQEGNNVSIVAKTKNAKLFRFGPGIQVKYVV